MKYLVEIMYQVIKMDLISLKSNSLNVNMQNVVDFNFQQLNEILASVTFEVNAMAFTEARISNINFPSLISM